MLNARFSILFHLEFALVFLFLNDVCFVKVVAVCFIQSAIQEYFGSSTGQAVGVFFAGILSALFVYKKYSKP